jgi:cytohesin
MKKIILFMSLWLLTLPVLSDPLHDAVEEGTVEQVRRLLQSGIDINARDDDGETALHEAAEAGRLEMVRLLVEAGATRGVRDVEGETPLHEAVEDGHLEVVRYLVLHGAPVNIINSFDDEGRSALHLAIAEKKEGVALFLISAGAGLGYRTADLKAALDLAKASGQTAVVQAIESRRP